MFMKPMKNTLPHALNSNKLSTQKKIESKTFCFIKHVFSCALIIITSATFAQTVALNPTPHVLNITAEIALPKLFNLQQKNNDKATQELLAKYFNLQNTSRTGFLIAVGDVNSKFSNGLKKKVPAKPESYYISSTKNEITVIGRDARGAYYGVQTLLALLQANKMPLGEIIDFPDVTARGVVEGFYGTPWSFESRIRQLDFYGLNKLNTYIYGPKDDPYHSSPNWRKPYPEAEATQLKKLIDRAEMNHVDFVWAIHPGQDIKWNEQDRAALLNKFGLMYDLGVRAYAVFFDDISGEGTNAKQQAQLLNYINTEFVKVKKDVKPLIMCPTEYNKAWANPKSGYLETLGKELDPSVRIMWTGNSVIADIDQPTMDWINAKLQREAFIWWNFPVSDYVRNHMLLGPTYGNATDIANKVSGFVSNPMEHAEASKIAIYGVADYTWNMAQYQSEKKWLSAIKAVMPTSYNALEVFARHNSDLGKNGHGYRREESVSFKPMATSFLSGLKANQKIENFDAVQNEFQSMVEATFILLNSTDNPALITEIRVWVEQFKLQGESGLTMLQMYKGLQAKDTTAFERSYNAFKAIRSQMYAIDRKENQNPYQPGVKTGTLVIDPLIDDSFAFLTNTYNTNFSKSLSVESNYNPHILYTNIAQLKNQPVVLRDRLLSLNTPLEVIQIKPNEYFGVELKEAGRVPKLTYKLVPSTAYKNLKIETSADGLKWDVVKGEEKNEIMQAGVRGLVKYVRVTNTSSENVDVKIDYVRLELK